MTNSKTIRKFMLTMLLMATLFIPGKVFATTSEGGFHDEEISENNSMETSTLDMEMRSGQVNFGNADDLFRGDTTTRDIYVKNTGDMEFKYKSFVELEEGTDTALCENLKLRVWYNWYDSSSIKHMESKYNGSLVDFEINFDGNDDELQIPNEHEYVSNGFYSDGEHWFYYRLEVPEDADYDLSQKTCEFKIKTIAWQTNLDDENQGFWDEETIENTVVTANWAPYVKIEDPEHEDMVEGTVDIYGTVTDEDPHHYWLVIQNSSGATVDGPGVVNESNSFENQELFEWDTTKVPNGTYTIKLEARDAAGNKDPDLAPVLIDPENPNDSVDWIDVEVENGDSAEEGEILINEIMWSGSSDGSSDEWIELYNDTTREIKLKNWEIVGAGSGGGSIILPASATISSGGYYLIANYSSSDGNSDLNVSVDFVTTALDLSDEGEDLQLTDAFENVIDRAGTSAGWLAGEIEEIEEGEEEDTVKWRSMERNNTPGNGTDSGDWHTCIDELCNDDTYWDTEGNNYGTPGSENHSENDPTSEDKDSEEEDKSTAENVVNTEEETESENPSILNATMESESELEPEPIIPEVEPNTQVEEETTGSTEEPTEEDASEEIPDEKPAEEETTNE